MAPAIANAFEDAIRTRITESPTTPERVARDSGKI
jgi:CO/xanthine dehydrogenase Mo-binding subunit